MLLSKSQSFGTHRFDELTMGLHHRFDRCVQGISGRWPILPMSQLLSNVTEKLAIHDAAYLLNSVHTPSTKNHQTLVQRWKSCLGNSGQRSEIPA